MKKVIIALLLSAMGYSSFAKGDLDNQTYFRIGLTRPTWKYMGSEGKDDYGDGTKRKGGLFEFGSIFMLNSLPIGDGMRLGINADYLSIYTAGFKADDDLNNRLTTFFIGSKIGPSFTYSPVSNLELDVFAKLHPVWLSTSFMYNDDYPADEAVSDYFLGSTVQMKYSLGFNVRYSVAMLGFDYCPGRMKTFEYFDGEKSDEPAKDMDDKNLKYDTFNFTLGVSF